MIFIQYFPVLQAITKTGGVGNILNHILYVI